MEEMALVQDKMINKNNKNIFALMFLVLLIPIVLAVTGVIQIDTFYDSSTSQPLTNVDSLIFNCADSSCASVGSQVFTLNSGSANQITFEYPYNPSSTDSNRDYYAHYLFKQCYMPKEYVESIWGFGATLNYDYNFNKAESCHSPIDSFSITNSNYVNEPVVMDIQANLEADAHSAFTNLLLEFVPSGFESYYSAETDIILEIKNSAGTVVYTETKTYEILQDTFQNVQFTWTPSVKGDYTASVKTDVTDCQCQSSFEQSSSKEFLVWEERPQDEAYTIINDLEAVPEFATEGETVTVRFNKISNYADVSFVKTAVQTRVTYEITDSLNNLVFNDSVLLAANANTIDPQNIEFTWVPGFGGNFNIRVTGVCEDALCVGKTNPVDVAILGFFVSSINTYDITFFVSDSETLGVLSNANVVFGTQNGVTDAGGKVVFNSNIGINNWDVSLTGYTTKTGSIDVTGDSTINVALVPIETDSDDDSDSDSSSSSDKKKSSGGTRILNTPVFSSPKIESPITHIDLGPQEKDKDLGNIGLLLWVLIAEVVFVLGMVLFILGRRLASR